jgi:PAS domain S-box-containing protein
MAIILLALGVLTLIYLFVVMREWRATRELVVDENPEPIVPVNLVESGDGVIVAEGRGRLVYVNDQAREWFGMNGDEPNLTVLANRVQPSDTFRDVLAQEGQAVFRIGQRQVEATSHAIPTESGRRVVVVMRELTGGKRGHEFDPMLAINMVNEVSAVLTRSRNLEETLDAILHSIGSVITFDFCEVNYWEADRSVLRPIGRLGDPTYATALQRHGGVYQIDEGYSGWLARYRQPLIIQDTESRQNIVPKIPGFRFRSFVGVPLMVGDRFVGTLELVSLQKDAFTYQDMTLLQSISGQVAVAIENTRLYRDQSHRLEELSGLKDIAQAMMYLGNTRAMFEYLHQSLAKLMQVDICGVLLPDEGEVMLVGQSPVHGIQDVLLPHFRIPVTDWGRSVWQERNWWYTNDALDDPNVVRLDLQTLVEVLRVRALAIVPMVVGDRRTGAIMVANPRERAFFTDDDMRSLSVFASEVAIVVENVRLSQRDRRRTGELEGLQRIAESIRYLTDPVAFYSQITYRVKEVLGVSHCAIWLYDPSTQALVLQPPTFDLDSLRGFQLSPDDSPFLKDNWEGEGSRYSNHVASLRSAGQLAQVIEKTDMAKTMLAVLRLGDEPIGLLQVGNLADSDDFTDDDAEVLRLYASQVEVLVNNARLYAETHQRAVEADSLRQIAEQLASAVSLEDVVGEVLHQIAALLNCQAVAVGLLDITRGKLVYEPQFVYGRELETAVVMDIFSQGFVHSVALSRRSFISHDAPNDETILPEYQEAIRNLGIQTVLTVPLVIQDRSIGELTAFNRHSNRFDENAENLLNSIAAQIAALIERARLYAATDADLRERVQELNAMDRIGQELAQSLELDHILDVTSSELARATSSDTVSVVLLAPRSEWLEATTPIIEKRVGGQGLTSNNLAPIELAAITKGESIYVGDYAQSEFVPAPADVTSALVEPLVVDGVVVGLLHVFSPAPDAFSDRQRIFLARVAKQTALAVANARHYREQLSLNEVLQARASRVGKVYELGQTLQQETSLNKLMDKLAKSVAEATGFRRVLIRVINPETGIAEATGQTGLRSSEMKTLRESPPPVEDSKRMFQDRWRIGQNTYFLPAEYESEWFQDFRGRTSEMLAQQQAADVRRWNDDDVFLAPLYGTGMDGNRELLGWISLDAPEDGLRPNLVAAETLEVFALEAAFTIENHRFIQAIRQEAASTRAERDRLALLHLVASDLQRAADMPTRLQAIVEGIQGAGWRKVRLSLHDEAMNSSILVQVGYTEQEAARLRAAMRSGDIWRERFADPGFRSTQLGGAFYLRYDHPWVLEHVFQSRIPVPLSIEPNKWHPQDVVYLPLYSQNQERIIGIIGMEDPADGLAPTEASLKPIQLFAAQAAAAIENSLLYLETRRQTETEKRMTEMMESLASSLEMENVLRTMAEGLQQMIAFTRMHVALPSADGKVFNMRRVEVTADQKVHIFEDEPLPFEGTALAQCYRDHQRQLYHLRSAKDAGSYIDLKRWRQQGERITMVVPMIAGGEAVGVLRLGSELESAFGFEENADLVGRMANLSAVTINHSRLVNDLVASTAYNEAVVESIQQGIIVLDTEHRVTTVNAFIKQRYGWTDEAIGKSLYEYEPDFQVFLKHSIKTALEAGEPQHQFEIQDFDKEGNRMIRNFYTYPLRQGEAITGVVLLVEDVTERAILESSLAQRAEQLSALTRVSGEITSTLDPDQVVSVVLEALESVMPFDGVTLWLREGDRLRVSAARGFRDPGTASPEELVGLYVDLESSELFRDMSRRRNVLNVGDTGASDPRFPYGHERVYKNWMGAPLLSQNEVVGVIALEKREANYYDTNHEQLLLTFANQAAVALRNAQLFDQTTERAAALDAQTRRLELLNRVAVALAQSLDIENIFEITLRETAIALDIEEAAALKIDHENELARVVVEFPRGEREPDAVFSLVANSVVRRLRETLLPMVIDDFQHDPVAKELLPWMRRDDVQSVLIVPLVVGGTVIGLMHFDCLAVERNFFNHERTELAQTLASQAAIAVQNASLFEQSVMRTHELETLFEAAQATAVTESLEEAMTRVVSQAISALRADYCSIALWDEVENHLEIYSSATAWGDNTGVEPTGTIYDLGQYPMREQALRQREVVNLRFDATLHPSERAVMERNGARDRLLVPLVVNEYSIGLLDLEIREQHRYFDATEIRLARTLASQSAVAIENARLQSETRSQIEELYIINDLSAAVSSKVNIDELFPMVRDQLPLLTDADILYVVLVDQTTHQLTFPIAVGVKGEVVEMSPLPLGNDEFSYVINRKAPLLLWGARMPETRASYGIATVLPDSKCFLGVPMMAGDEVVGVLAVQDNSNPRAFGLNDQRILTTVASQLGVAIQNARLFAQTTELAEELEQRVQIRTTELEQERRRVQTLYDITTEVASSLDINRVLSQALQRVAEAIHATSAVIMGIDEVSEQLYVLHSWGGIPVKSDEERTQLRQDQGLAGWVLANRQGVVIKDVQEDPRWSVTGKRDLAQRACVAALLEVGEDSRGVMMLFSDKVGAFDEEHLKLVTAAASQLANSMNNAELYSLIRDQAERLGAILRDVQVESTKNTAIFDSIADGVMYANEHGTIVLFNTAAERILGLPVERVVTRSITEFTGLYGGSSGLWLEAMERWMNDPAAYRDGDFVEELIQLEDGRVVSVRLSPVNMGDQFLGTVSIFRDITKIVEVDRLKSEFVSTVSHELRTPMTSIKGYADLLLLGAAGEVSEAQQRFLETIKTNADRLSFLVNDLLEVSKIDQDRVPMRFTRVDVAELLGTIQSHLEGRIEEKKRDLNLSLEVPDDLPAVRADYDRAIQIMQNLADNAFNYTKDGGLIRLTAEYDKVSDTVIMSVIDTGVGIPKEIQHRVFERFFRGDEYDDVVLDTAGTGLGLSIVKSLVEMHNGDIWFESEVGKGTAFHVRLPIALEQASAD